MVEDPRTTAGTRGLRPLNEPAPIAVVAPNGEPQAVLSRGRLVPVAAVHDRWRIDDEWWRAPIVRQYFVIEMRDGQRLTVFHDLVRDAWYRQPYPSGLSHRPRPLAQRPGASSFANPPSGTLERRRFPA